MNTKQEELKQSALGVLAKLENERGEKHTLMSNVIPILEGKECILFAYFMSEDIDLFAITSADSILLLNISSDCEYESEDFEELQNTLELAAGHIFCDLEHMSFPESFEDLEDEMVMAIADSIDRGVFYEEVIFSLCVDSPYRIGRGKRNGVR